MESYLFPKEIKSDYQGYASLVELAVWLRGKTGQEIVFDFRNNTWFEANLVAVLGAILNEGTNCTNYYRFANLSSWQVTTFHKNRFLSDYGFPPMVKIASSAIPYQKFRVDEGTQFSNYIRQELISKRSFPKHTPLVAKKINESIFELFENARTHGRCGMIITCGQIYPKKDIPRLDISIVDMGQTIKANVNNYLNRELNGYEAIEWAFEYGHTTKTGTNPGGLGLSLIMDFIKLNNGKIQIVSSDGYWEYRRGERMTNLFPFPFPGTIANIEFNLADTNYYLMKEEVSLDDIF